MKRFKSKVDIKLVMIVVAIVFIASLPFILTPNAGFAGFVINGITLLIFADMVINTEYIIDGKILRVKCGHLIKQQCNIMDITAVKPTRTLVSSPAMSLDRLELKLRDKSIIISPKDKTGFVDALRAVNPEIKVVS